MTDASNQDTPTEGKNSQSFEIEHAFKILIRDFKDVLKEDLDHIFLSPLYPSSDHETILNNLQCKKCRQFFPFLNKIYERANPNNQFLYCTRCLIKESSLISELRSKYKSSSNLNEEELGSIIFNIEKERIIGIGFKNRYRSDQEPKFEISYFENPREDINKIPAVAEKNEIKAKVKNWNLLPEEFIDQIFKEDPPSEYQIFDLSKLNEMYVSTPSSSITSFPNSN